MGIEFLKNENIFHLSGGDVSYILKIYKNAFPMHLYWGKRLSDPAISWYLEAPYRRKKLLEGTQPNDPIFLHEFWPYEYPEYGMSDYRPAALEVVGQMMDAAFRNCVMKAMRFWKVRLSFQVCHQFGQKKKMLRP